MQLTTSFQQRDKSPYKSLVCEVIGRAYKDAQGGKLDRETALNVDWSDIPWAHTVDVPINAIRQVAENPGN